MNTSFYNESELQDIGFKNLGNNVLISKKASIYGAENITIGNNVRIDDFCILSGNIEIGNFVHIGAYSALFGKIGIKMKDFSGLSSRCTIYSANDDYSGEYFPNSPVVPQKYCKIYGGEVILHKYVNIGTGSTLMPNIILEEGTVIGSMSLVNFNTKEWTIYFGIPAIPVNKRKKNIIELEKELLNELK